MTDNRRQKGYQSIRKSGGRRSGSQDIRRNDGRGKRNKQRTSNVEHSTSNNELLGGTMGAKLRSSISNFSSRGEDAEL
jgi:hypothetical protein